MRKTMDALPTEVEMRDHSTIINRFIFFGEVEDKSMGIFNLGSRDGTLLEELNCRHQLTEVRPVEPWKNVVE